MNSGILIRYVIFFTAILLLLGLIGWTAHITWKRTGLLHEQLSETEWKSFQTSDHLQQTILSLNNMVLRYAAYQNLSDWTNFCVASHELGQWINQQQPILSSQQERPFLNQISTAFQDYMAAATAINNKIYGTGQSITRVVEFTDLERQSKRILDLGFELSKAHQNSLDLLQSENIESLDVLRFLVMGCLGLLLLACLCLAFLVYRDTIKPLQIQLVESRQLMERQEKLASLGMLAAGVAHEIRKPPHRHQGLGSIFNKNIPTPPAPPNYGDAELISGEINRLERIVRDFLQFARPSDPKFAVIPAEQSLREVQQLMSPELARLNIQLNVEGDHSGNIQVDTQQIKQVLLNLIRNAAESIGRDGIVTLRARRDEKWLEDRQSEVVILEALRHPGKVRIPPDAEKRLFDPFLYHQGNRHRPRLCPSPRASLKNTTAPSSIKLVPDVGTTFGIILPAYKNHECPFQNPAR